MIGLFDGGIGGLTVARAVMDRLPGYDLIYFGDTARSPYGDRSPETVLRYSLEGIQFLLDRGVRCLVLAGNTVSSIAGAALAGQFPVPVVEMTAPAVAEALKLSRKNRFGVIGSRATTGSGAHRQMIQSAVPAAPVHSAACPLLASLAETGWHKKPETAMIVKKYLHPLKVRQIDTLILAGNHYPVLKPVIRHKAGADHRVRLVDSVDTVAGAVRALLAQDHELDARMSRNGNYRFYVSDLTEDRETAAKRFFGRNIRLEPV